MPHSIVFNTSQICSQLGVKHAVMSPGSRNAPLTISFARHTQIEKHIIPDERVAGFIALGIAQKTKTPVVLCCTSGTALLNYAPAIAEAYYREIPLIVLSADRPPHLIDQRDGQTIRQYEALKNHVKASYQLPIVNTEQEAENYKEQLIDAINTSQTLPKGPVHINIPFEEPFYPKKDDDLKFENFDIQVVTTDALEGIKISVKPYKKVLIVIGQHDTDSELSNFLSEIVNHVPVLQSPLNNLQIDGIKHSDGFIDNQPELTPDILITYGLSVLSKKLKTFLRKNPPQEHFHFDPAGIAVDTFESNPMFIRSSLIEGLSAINFALADKEYVSKWRQLSMLSYKAIGNYFHNPVFSESSSFHQVLETIPQHSHLHLGNSMPVRFADLIGVGKDITTWSNRGTSGIDGCSSTAVGNSLIGDDLNILLSGDVSFFYDRNAFFHNYPLPNLRVVVFNNQGGGIFRLIEGPANLPELEDYFETRHKRSAKYMCLENEMEYVKASTIEEIKEALTSFYKPSKHAKVLEIFTDPATNQKEYKKLKQYIYEQIRN